MGEHYESTDENDNEIKIDVEGFLQVFWRQSNFACIAINVFILLGFAVLINIFTLIRFRSGKVI